MSKTTNALEILRRRIGDDEEARTMLAEERAKSQAAQAIYDARTAAGLTQQQLAERVGTKQPVIARLEAADYEGHTLTMLSRIAAALNLRAEVRLVSPSSRETQTPPADPILNLDQVRSALAADMHREVYSAVEKAFARKRNQSQGAAALPRKPDTSRLWEMEAEQKAKRSSSASDFMAYVTPDYAAK